MLCNFIININILSQYLLWKAIWVIRWELYTNLLVYTSRRSPCDWWTSCSILSCRAVVTSLLICTIKFISTMGMKPDKFISYTFLYHFLEIDHARPRFDIWWPSKTVYSSTWTITCTCRPGHPLMDKTKTAVLLGYFV